MTIPKSAFFSKIFALHPSPLFPKIPLGASKWQFLKKYQLLAQFGVLDVKLQFLAVLRHLGATSIEKIPKISASGRNFLDPLPPLRKRALPTKTSVFHT